MMKRIFALLLVLTMVLSTGAIMVSANETNETPEETLPTLVAYHGSITVDGSILTDKQVTSRQNEIDANAHVPLGNDVYLGLAWGSERLSEEDAEDEAKVAAAKSYFYVLIYSYGQNLTTVELTLGDEEMTLTRGEDATLPEGAKAAFGKAMCNMGDLFTDAEDGTEQDWQEFDSAFELQFPLEKLDFEVGNIEVTLPFEIKVTTDENVVEKKANVRISAINPHYIISMVGYQNDDYTTGGSWTSGNNPEQNTFRTFLLNGWNLRQVYHENLTPSTGIQIGCNGRNTVRYGDNNFVKMQLTIHDLPEGAPKEKWKAWSADTQNPARVRIVLGVNNSGNNPKKATVLDLYNGGDEKGLFLYRDVGETIIEGEPLRESSVMYIGKKVGDTFDLSLHMLPDNSLTVWVDNEEVGIFPAMDESVFTAKSSGVGGGGYGWYIGILPGSNIATGATPNDLEIEITVVNTLEGTGEPLDVNAFASVVDGTYANYEVALDPPDTDDDDDDDDNQQTDPPVTSAPQPSTDAPDNTTTDAPGTSAPADDGEKRGSCGSSIAGGAIALICTVGLAGVAFKKKKND